MKFRHLATILTVGSGTVATLILLALLGNLSAAVTHEPILSLSSTIQKPTTSSLSDATPIHYVARTGIDGGDCSTPASACRTVQYAVDQAGAGDEVRIAAGGYTDVHRRPVPPGYPNPPASGVITQVVYISKTLTVRGGYTTTNWTMADPAANPTTLDAQRQGRVIYIGGDISPTIEGLRITSGDATGLRGWGSGWDAGGGVYVISAAAILSNNLIFDNKARGGGGLYLLRSDALVKSNTISDNIASWSCGGLFLHQSVARLSRNTINTNTSAEFDGGGLCLVSSSAVLTDNVVSANSSNKGGGLYFSYSSARLSRNTISGNTAVDPGGGLYLYHSTAGLNGDVIRGNTATGYWGGGGGGMYLAYSDVIMTNTLVIDNQAAVSASGLYISASSSRLLHTTIARNTGGDGSGIYISDDESNYSTVALTNTILVSHTVGVTVTTGNAATLNGVLWYGNTTNYDGEGHITVADEYTGNPTFDTDGYHLRAASAAIDRGVSAGVNNDIDGEPRPLDGNLDGIAIPDIGADEFSPPTIYVPLVVSNWPPTPTNGCLDSGGTVTTGMCCLSVGDFPNSCAIGACGCAPQDSYEVQICDCGPGRCFDGYACVPVAGE